MSVVVENGQLVIRVPMNADNPPVSSTGKTRLVASDRAKTVINVQGKQLTVAVNAYIPAE